MIVFNHGARSGPAIPDATDRFIERWTAAEQAERSNAPPFLIELCEVLGVERPPPAQGGIGPYRFERSVTRHAPDGRETIRRIDLYRHGCFILEAKQGANRPAQIELVAPQAEATRRQAIRNLDRSTVARPGSQTDRGDARDRRTSRPAG